jgi:hypothetical protein
MLRLLVKLVLVLPVPLSLWPAVEAVWWPYALCALTVVMFLVLALVPWAAYREAIGRPLAIAHVLPKDDWASRLG